MKNPLRLLGLDPETVNTVGKANVGKFIRTQRTSLMKFFHPDSGAVPDEVRFKQIGEAFQSVDPDKPGSHFDFWLKRLMQPVKTQQYNELTEMESVVKSKTNEVDFMMENFGLWLKTVYSNSNFIGQESKGGKQSLQISALHPPAGSVITMVDTVMENERARQAYPRHQSSDNHHLFHYFVTVQEDESLLFQKTTGAKSGTPDSKIAVNRFEKIPYGPIDTQGIRLFGGFSKARFRQSKALKQLPLLEMLLKPTSDEIISRGLYSLDELGEYLPYFRPVIGPGDYVFGYIENEGIIKLIFLGESRSIEYEADKTEREDRNPPVTIHSQQIFTLPSNGILRCSNELGESLSFYSLAAGAEQCNTSIRHLISAVDMQNVKPAELPYGAKTVNENGHPVDMYRLYELEKAAEYIMPPTGKGLIPVKVKMAVQTVESFIKQKKEETAQPGKIFDAQMFRKIDELKIKNLGKAIGHKTAGEVYVYAVHDLEYAFRKTQE